MVPLFISPFQFLLSLSIFGFSKSPPHSSIIYTTSHPMNSIISDIYVLSLLIFIGKHIKIYYYYINNELIIYKEKITILPLIPPDHIHKIYKNIVSSLRFNCYLCGPFNKTEISNLVNSIQNAIRIKSNSSRNINFYPQNSRSNTIHFHTTYEIEILKVKTERLSHNLNFLIAGRCCSGKGSTLYIKH